MLCDHHLDPRLRKRFKWLTDNHNRCTAYVDKSRGQHFSSSVQKELDLASLKLNELRLADLIYVSGAKVVFTFFIQLLIARYVFNKKLVYEIPDLPLRKGSILRNYIKSVVFKFVVFVLFENVVITSNAFKKKLPANINYLLCENLPNLECDKYDHIESEGNLNDMQDISFIGALRYLEQMKMLIRYGVDRQLKIGFSGGPLSAEAELMTFATDYGCSDLITFSGKYEQSDLPRLYSKSRFVFSVYDSSQENVRLALPNKLYESILFNRPLIVSNNTHLAEIVFDYKIGFSVDSLDYKNFCIDMDEGIGKEYEINKCLVLQKINDSKCIFTSWVNEIVS